MGDDDFKLSRRRGWLVSTSHERIEEWFADCVERGVDCLVVRKNKGELNLICHVLPEHPISPLAYLELGDLMQRWELPSGCLGDDYGPGYFMLEIPPHVRVEELVEEVRACLRRDRAPRRQIELRYTDAPREGMAVALSPDGLWPDHPMHHPVYVLEISPGRCLVLKHLHPPLVDLPLSQFRLHNE